jgi:hypothetical protein
VAHNPTPVKERGMSKTKRTPKTPITQATSLVLQQPPLTERARARYYELLELAVVKFFGKENVEHLQADARVAAGKPGRVWNMDGETLNKITAPLQETLARKATPKDKPLTSPLTLADIRITWHDGIKEQELTPDQITLALAYTWGMLNDGMGDFNLFRDAGEANRTLQAAEDLILSLAQTEEAGSPVESPSYWALHDLVQDGRIRYEMSNHPPKPETYRVEISTPAKGGAR